MKKTLSMLLAVLFALTAFGATTLFGSVLGASAIFYDYYEYYQFPGFSAFTAEDIALTFRVGTEFAGFSSDYKPDGVDEVATFNCGTPGQHGVYISTINPINLETHSYGPQPNCMWTANDTLNGKDFFGDSGVTFEDCAGFCFWIGINGGHYDGNIKIQLFQVPCRGPEYTNVPGDKPMSEYDTGLVFEAEGMKADEDGYVYFDFKTDFYWPGWWYADDDGVKHQRGTENGGKFPICQKYLPKLNGIQILLSQAQSGDVISIGDFRAYKDTRIHTEDLEEQCNVFDALDPDAYTEESYGAATNVYLEAYAMLQEPDNYTQKQIDEKAKELKNAIRDLMPMFKAEMKSVKLAGFEVWDEDDLDEIHSGGYCLDTPAIEDQEETHFPSNREQSLLIMANSVDGPPTYGWSLFSNATDEDEDGYPDGAIKNPFELLEGSKPLSEASGIRFWLKWDKTFIDHPTACRIGLGSSEDDVYFECEETAVQLPEEKGYIGVAWANFFDTNGDEDIYDYIDSLDYIAIYLEDAIGIYYIADLTGFEWSLSGADFEALEAEIADTKAYLASLNKADWYYKSWERVEEAVEYAESILGKYGTEQDDADKALSDIQTAKNRMKLVGDLADEPTAKRLEGLYKSGHTYWRGNVTGASYLVLKNELDVVGELIEEGPTQTEAEQHIAALEAAIAGLVPIKEGSKVTSIYSFERYSTRDFSRATGDRTANVLYELDKTFEKLPDGYDQALKMTAQIDLGSETTDQHGMMQFKAMYREGGTASGHPTPILMEGSGKNAVNTLIGDLSGTAGLCLWVGVNDMNLVQKATMRVAVSNCEVGPLFERATVDIPVPANGQGWIYLPWEYFEYYDDWTEGHEIDLAKIFFYIIRFDGVIKAGLEVYVTGIYAYKDPTAGTWAAPVVTGVAEGENYDISENALIPDWDVGAAMLDGEFLIYGNPVTKNGEHTLVVTNGDKSTTVNFTTSGAIEYEEPVANVENGKTYQVGQAITWTPEGATATLDGEEIENGYVVETTGEYVLVVTNGDKEIEIVFTVSDEPPVPPVKKGVANVDGKISVDDALTALRVAARLAEPTEELLAICDIDGNGKIEVNDALAILRVAARLATEESLQ